MLQAHVVAWNVMQRQGGAERGMEGQEHSCTQVAGVAGREPFAPMTIVISPSSLFLGSPNQGDHYHTVGSHRVVLICIHSVLLDLLCLILYTFYCSELALFYEPWTPPPLVFSTTLITILSVQMRAGKLGQSARRHRIGKETPHTEPVERLSFLLYFGETRVSAIFTGNDEPSDHFCTFCEKAERVLKTR
jgi:hypothetical protein